MQTYWTIRQNWDGKLWPRLWPSRQYAWRQIKRETGWTQAQVREKCDWTLVEVTLTEVKPSGAARPKTHKKAA